jgi:multiple sugar transport system permease protein
MNGEERRSTRTGRILWTSFAALVVLIWLGPILWMLNISFKTRAQISVKTPTFLFTPTLKNYEAIFTEVPLLKYLTNSLIIATSATVVTLVLASMAVYAFTRFDFKGRGGILNWVLSLRMLPTIAVVVPFYILFQRLNMLDTYHGMIIAYLPMTLPFAIWLLYGFVRELPKTLDEAAILDGCGYWKTFSEIIMPLSLPSLAVSGIFTFILVWNEFLLAMIMTGYETKTVAVGMSEFILSYEVVWGQLAAASMVFLLPLLLVVFLLQRYIVQGMTLGAIR